MGKRVGDAHPILEVTPHLYPDVLGGIGLDVHLLAAALSSELSVTVVSNWLGSDDPPTGLPYQVTTFRTRLAPLGNPVSGKMLVWLLTHANEYQLIHVHSHLFLSSVIGILVAKLKQIPVVITNHGMISLSQPVSLQRIWTSFVAKLILRSCEEVLCYTETDADRMATLGITPSRIQTISPGVDLSSFRPMRRTFTGPLRAVWLGRLVKDKGLTTLLEALRKTRDLSGKLKVTIVGEGVEKGSLVQYARDQNLDEMVEFKAPVEYSSVPSLLESHDIMIFPSLTEGLPRVVLEALATSMPLICTSLPQLTMALGNCAVYFAAGNSDELAGKIRWAETNRVGLRQLGERGRDLVVNRFSMESALGARRRLFLEIIGRN